MLRSTIKILLVPLLFLLVLSVTDPVSAKPSPPGQAIRETKQAEIDEIKNQMRENVQQRVASMAAYIRSFRNGHIAIGRGELTAINGNTLTVVKEGNTYTVLVDEKTQLRRKFWGKSDLTEWTVGDMISIIGTWEDEAKTTIRARLIKNLSIQMRHGVFFGTITSLGNTGFTMDSVRRGTQTVTVGEDTRYIDRRGGALEFSGILVGHRVRVRGLWNSRTATISEVTEVKDFSLPEIAKQSDKPSVTPEAE